MARLSAKERAALPKGEFAVPSLAGTAKAKKKSGNYPINDRAHARAAKSMAARFASPSKKAQVDVAVARKYPDMGKGKAKGEK